MTIATPSPSSSLTTTQMSEMAVAKGNTFKFKYFPFHGVVEAARAMLYMSGEKYEFVHPEWPQEKPNTPFGVLPVLEIVTESGEELVLSELSAVEYFLAKKFGFMGKNLWEEHIIQMVVSSTSAVFDKFIVTVLRNPESMREELSNRWLDLILPEWIKYHERFLLNAGNTGYYIKGSDNLSLAEIKGATLLPTLMKIAKDRDCFSEEKTPALFKMLETAKKHPGYAKWLESDECKAYTAKNVSLFGF
ncbi:hypothetical protein BGW41_007191 [Actinomortierella wolfii]|nr:hypothetical protein BGW41_007191 [Actinomortierella wolfii]